MVNFVLYALIIVSVLLTAAVIVQSKGTGLSLAPGSGDFGKFERRGAEKTLHAATIVLAVIFTLLAMAHFFLA